jgi:hypothetical protein
MTTKQKSEIVEFIEQHRVADIGNAGKEYNKKLDRMIFAVKSSSVYIPARRAFDSEESGSDNGGM